MKMLKKLTALLSGVAFLCALVLTPAMKSRADGPVTYYITNNGGAWYASSSETVYWTGGMDFVYNNIKDGDHLVINGNSSSTDLFRLTVDKKLGDLAVTGGAVAHIEAPYVERAYVAGKGSTLIVTAPLVNNVEIYPGQVIQVNGNVTNFLAHYEYNTSDYPVYAVTGTVAAANVAYGGVIENSHHTIYGIGNGLLKSDDHGSVYLSDTQYSLTPTAVPKSGTTDKSADSSKKQLDKVPQTGSEVSMETFIFGGLALLFAAAAVMVGFTSKKNN